MITRLLIWNKPANALARGLKWLWLQTECIHNVWWNKTWWKRNVEKCCTSSFGSSLIWNSLLSIANAVCGRWSLLGSNRRRSLQRLHMNSVCWCELLDELHRCQRHAVTGITAPSPQQRGRFNCRRAYYKQPHIIITHTGMYYGHAFKGTVI
jgi:hypothetical protein